MRIGVLTESRADWGGLEPVVREARSRGHLVEIVAPYEWTPENWIYSNHVTNPPDWVVLLGDRRRVLNMAIEFYEAGIGIAHLSGGDRQTGRLIDEPCRHAISKFAHVHFPNSDKSAQRLMRHGEDESRIFMVGSTMVDDLVRFKPKRLPWFRQFALVVHNPAPRWQLELRQICEAHGRTFIIRPNSDKGYGPPPEELEYEDAVGRGDFLQLLWNCTAFVGNSSALFLEAQYIGTPCVHVGQRNSGREESFPGHIAAHADARTERGLRDRWTLGAHGDGRAAAKIVDVLEFHGRPTPGLLSKEWL